MSNLPLGPVDTLRVVVLSLAGESTEFKLERGSRISGLKSVVAKQWKVPVLTLQFCLGADVVSDEEDVREGCYHALVSLSRACTEMETGPRQSRLEAVEALGELGGRAGAAVDAICARMADEDPEVRKVAAHALGCIVPQGHTGVVANVCSCIDHPSWRVRLEAAQFLARASEKGDPEAIAALCGRLKDDCSDVRHAAAQSLAEIAQGDCRAVEAAVSCLGDARWRVRLEGLQSLLMVTDKGDDCVVDAVCQLMEDAVSSVREAALLAVPQIRRQGQRALNAVCTRLEDEALSNVRLIALQALSQIADVNEEQARVAVTQHLQRELAEAKRDAVQACVGMFARGGQSAMLAFCTRLKYAGWPVSTSNAKLLVELTDSDDKAVLAACAWLLDEKPLLSQAAEDTLVQTAAAVRRDDGTHPISSIIVRVKSDYSKFAEATEWALALSRGQTRHLSSSL